VGLAFSEIDADARTDGRNAVRLSRRYERLSETCFGVELCTYTRIFTDQSGCEDGRRIAFMTPAGACRKCHWRCQIRLALPRPAAPRVPAPQQFSNVDRGNGSVPRTCRSVLSAALEAGGILQQGNCHRVRSRWRPEWHTAIRCRRTRRPSFVRSKDFSVAVRAVLSCVHLEVLRVRTVMHLIWPQLREPLPRALQLHADTEAQAVLSAIGCAPDPCATLRSPAVGRVARCVPSWNGLGTTRR
jgi:hypothetical protein